MVSLMITSLLIYELQKTIKKTTLQDQLFYDLQKSFFFEIICVFSKK